MKILNVMAGKSTLLQRKLKSSKCCRWPTGGVGGGWLQWLWEMPYMGMPASTFRPFAISCQNVTNGTLSWDWTGNVLRNYRI